MPHDEYTIKALVEVGNAGLHAIRNGLPLTELQGYAVSFNEKIMEINNLVESQVINMDVAMALENEILECWESRN